MNLIQFTPKPRQKLQKDEVTDGIAWFVMCVLMFWRYWGILKQFLLLSKLLNHVPDCRVTTRFFFMVIFKD